MMGLVLGTSRSQVAKHRDAVAVAVAAGYSITENLETTLFTH
jgi:hypothetical protein